MRTLLLLVALALVAAPAWAQGDGANATGSTNETASTANETATGNETATPANESAAGNDTGATNETPADAGPQKVEVSLEAHASGGSFYWTLPDGTRNPTLRFPPGAEVTITIVNVDPGFHNLRVDLPSGPIKTGNIQDLGDTQTLTFTAPESGSFQYLCEYHQATMKGQVSIGETGAGGGADAGDIDTGVTGEAVDLGQYAPECAGVQIPAAATREVIGGATLQDYIDRCTGGAAGDGEPAAHPADWVIPISWALIGLGIVGVVWVHKYYKP